MSFDEELANVLPPDLPNRDAVVCKGAEHLRLIFEANQNLNLTRITSPREAAIKHVLDSVLPWRYFFGARRVLDAGTGAGFPGIPLALVLPETRFTLAESIQKKARFLDATVESLELPNVHVRSVRAEELLETHQVDLITARAMAPLNRALELFAPAIRKGSVAMLYKGPDVQTEIDAALRDAKKRRITLNILDRYELLDELGTRTLVRMAC